MKMASWSTLKKSVGEYDGRVKCSWSGTVVVPFFLEKCALVVGDMYAQIQFTQNIYGSTVTDCACSIA